MSAQAKLDLRHISTVAGNMMIGKQLVYATEAMVVDVDGNAWLDKYAVPLCGASEAEYAPHKKDHPEIIVVSLVETGRAVVRLARAPETQWTPKFIPEAERGRWMPVVDFPTD